MVFQSVGYRASYLYPGVLNQVLLPHPYYSHLLSFQSLQIAAFLFTVCHVVIMVQDWFTDLSLYR